MNALNQDNLHLVSDDLESLDPKCRDLLRAATQGPHERLHLHPGFSAVKDGTITRASYRALLICLYGFYHPFEQALGMEPVRTQWLQEDLLSLGFETGAFPHLRLCANVPAYDCLERKLGALYVAEGSALGGRVLCRGLEALLGPSSIEGRRFFSGRGSDTGTAWLSFLDQLASVGHAPVGRAALLSGAVETFEVFETWLSAWGETK